jgi:transcriptional regulator with XRE-family HTH domain
MFACKCNIMHITTLRITMNNEEIGTLIKQRRVLLNIKQSDLAEIAKVGLRYLNDIENGKGNPSIGKLEKILSVLGLQIEINVKK